MKKFIVPVALFAYIVGNTQERNDTTEMEPVEVKAVRAGAMAPFAKTTLYKKDFEKGNLGQDLPFLLNQTPSVVVNSDAGNGVGYTGIRIRGTDATRINITLNGIPYNDAESQGSFFVDLPDFASSVNSIQVQRGVGTSTNGSGAFGATINFSTNEVNKKQYLEFNNSYGSFHTLKSTLKAGSGLINDKFTVDMRLSTISSDGYMDRATSDLLSGYFSAAYLSGKTDIRLNVFSGKEKTYQAWNGVSESDLATNRTINYAGMEKAGEPYNNETDNYRQDHWQLFLTHRFNQQSKFNTAVFLTHGNGYYEQYKAGEDYAAYGMNYPMNGVDTIFTTDLVRQLWLRNNFYGTIFSFQHQTGSTQWIAGGAATRYDGNHFGKVIWTEKSLTNDHRWYNLDAFKNDVNLYVKWQKDILKTLKVFTDVQYRLVKYHLRGFRDNPQLSINNNYGFFNPKLGLTFHKNNYVAYASVSIAGKEPNRDDFEAGAEQQPSPEHMTDVELGIENKSGGRSWSANFYYMRYKDQLILTGKINDVGAYTRTNIPQSYRLGIELQGNLQLNQWLQVAANLAVSRNRILDFTEFIDDYDNGGQQVRSYHETSISYSPGVIGAASITVQPLKQLRFDVMGKYVGEQFLDNTANDNRKLDAYFVQDLRGVFSFHKKWLKNADIILQVNNIFDKMYEPNGYTFSYFYNNSLTTENYYFPMAGRNVMAGVNLKF